MIKEYKNSRFYPCPLAAKGDWCGGIVVLNGSTYECQRCKNQWTLAGYPVGYVPPQKLCTINGCDNKHSARGMCDKHYQRWYAKQPKGLLT